MRLNEAIRKAKELGVESIACPDGIAHVDGDWRTEDLLRDDWELFRHPHEWLMHIGPDGPSFAHAVDVPCHVKDADRHVLVREVLAK